MIVEPYKRTPVAPEVVWVDAEGLAFAEDGSRVDLDVLEPGQRAFAAWETVWGLVRDGRGEALCWQNEEIRWREDVHPEETDWKRRPSDVYVLRVPPLETGRALKALGRWRDWLASYGASPTGTTGSAAMSLLRATLERKLVTGQGMRPPLLQTLGGRQELGPAGAGCFSGQLVQVDLPAAYASTLAGLHYGGVWLEGSYQFRPWQSYAAEGAPTFVRARVKVPALTYGPLPQRSRRRLRSHLESVLLGASYPTARRLQGLWTWQELEAAEAAGCRVEKVLGAWVHRSGWQPFLPWWAAVQTGREMGGLAGLLAKMTGNALWGRFALDPRTGGSRSIRSLEGRRMVQRPLASRPSPWPAHDLAETVSGRVRARLYGLMVAAGDDLVSAHTDGAWLKNQRGERSSEKLVATPSDSSAWRVKQQARRLDLLDPQVLRYWPRSRPGPEVVYAGVPAGEAPAAFAAAWARHLEAAA